jgi:hypothetical protein
MFIDEWFGDDFYQKLPLGFQNPAGFVFGQMFWTHAYYPHENLDSGARYRTLLSPRRPSHRSSESQPQGKTLLAGACP